MLSYQHLYHAGNPADVHKHALLAWTLDYLTRKPKPLTYLESHAGRGLYDLAAPEALKTGEAAQGITRMAAQFPQDHVYLQALARVRAEHGPSAYPGSPLLAATLLRDIDALHLAELHPAEHAVLAGVMAPHRVQVHKTDGLAMALSRTPPEPRRGLLLIDPSWEVKDDYARIPKLLADLHKRWNVGILMLWYPVLTDARHRPMTRALRALLPGITLHEVAFPPARPGHGMVGSGLAVVNAPYGFDAEALAITRIFEKAFAD